MVGEGDWRLQLARTPRLGVEWLITTATDGRGWGLPASPYYERYSHTSFVAVIRRCDARGEARLMRLGRKVCGASTPVPLTITGFGNKITLPLCTLPVSLDGAPTPFRCARVRIQGTILNIRHGSSALPWPTCSTVGNYVLASRQQEENYETQTDDQYLATLGSVLGSGPGRLGQHYMVRKWRERERHEQLLVTDNRLQDHWACH